MEIKKNGKMSQVLSVKAAIFFLISLMLSSILITVAIVNRINMERLRMEQMVLETSLQITEELLHSDPVLESIFEDITTEGFSYELFKIDPVTNEREIIAEHVSYNKAGYRFIEKQIQNSNLYLRVFPLRVWYRYPVNLILIFTGFLLSILIFYNVQNNSYLKRMRSVFEEMARKDVLTGIFNRRHIEENLKSLINTLSRTDSVISVLMIDVDYFKQFNDTYGHGKGDSCLKTIADALAQSLFREEDFVARYGGEEFVVVLPSCDQRGAHKVAERLLKSVRDCNIAHAKNTVASCVTISVGVTTGKAEHSRSGDEYLKKADDALYMSKQSGRNKYTFLPFP